MQKFYSAATLFIVDPDRIPEDVKRYFLETQTEHLEGMFSVFKLYDRISEVSSENLEQIAKAMLRQLRTVGQKHAREEATEDAGSFRVKIYAEALANVTKQKEWQSLFQK